MTLAKSDRRNSAATYYHASPTRNAAPAQYSAGLDSLWSDTHRSLPASLHCLRGTTVLLGPHRRPFPGYRPRWSALGPGGRARLRRRLRGSRIARVLVICHPSTASHSNGSRSRSSRTSCRSHAPEPAPILHLYSPAFGIDTHEGVESPTCGERESEGVSTRRVSEDPTSLTRPILVP
jgi:hypothetical protein